LQDQYLEHFITILKLAYIKVNHYLLLVLYSELASKMSHYDSIDYLTF